MTALCTDNHNWQISLFSTAKVGREDSVRDLQLVKTDCTCSLPCWLMFSQCESTLTSQQQQSNVQPNDVASVYTCNTAARKKRSSLIHSDHKVLRVQPDNTHRPERTSTLTTQTEHSARWISFKTKSKGGWPSRMLVIQPASRGPDFRGGHQGQLTR